MQLSLLRPPFYRKGPYNADTLSFFHACTSTRLHTAQRNTKRFLGNTTSSDLRSSNFPCCPAYAVPTRCFSFPPSVCSESNASMLLLNGLNYCHAGVQLQLRFHALIQISDFAVLLGCSAWYGPPRGLRCPAHHCTQGSQSALAPYPEVPASSIPQVNK